MRNLNLILALTLFFASFVWLFYLALEPYVRRLWPELPIGWSRLLSGRVRDPLVGRDVLIGVAARHDRRAAHRGAGNHCASDRTTRADALPAEFLDSARPAMFAPAALEVVRAALTDALQCTCIVVFFRILVRRTWLVMLLSSVAILPIAMSGTFTGELLLLDVTMSLLGIALVFGVLLRFGLLALVVTFYTLLLIRQFPLTSDFARPYAASGAVVLTALAALSVFGFYASRGDEPLFGRGLLMDEH